MVEMIDMRLMLVKLEALIDWDIFEREWLGLFPSHTSALRHHPFVAVLPSACLCAFGRGRRGPLGGEPVLAAFLPVSRLTRPP